MWRWLVEVAGIALELFVLVRSAWVRNLPRYYFFYIYVASVMIASAVMMTVVLRAPGLYQNWYWPLQLTTLVTGYGILLEILNHVLAPYPGAERFARIACLAAFGTIFCFALIAPRVMPRWSPGTVIEFERDLRSVQALFIFGLLALIFYYGIPIARNMKGMVLGYGLYILTSLVSLAVRSYAGPSFTSTWRVVQPLCFDVTLVVWLVALWSYCPNPVPDHSIHLEEDYEALANRTRNVIGMIRTYIGKAARA
ncbi:MAG TPA: hypothetical protein VEJ38_14800 [Candidatus Acidoferrales bacterium]|nr:hypothetical protein [Candidatus Acidoferrales bacterium]